MLSKEDIKRVNKVDSCYIPHLRIDHAIKVIEENISLSVGSKEPQNVILFGKAGTGKTTTCNAILNRRKRKQITKKGKVITQVPAFYSLIPNPVTIKGVASSMLCALGDPTPMRGGALDLTYRLGKLLKQCDTEVILLDELQHLLAKDSYSKEKEVKNWLKAIINEYKVPIIVVGTADCSHVINSDDQLARRFTSQLELDNLDFGVDKQGEFRKFIMGLSNFFVKELKFESFPDFRSRDNALAVYISTGGNPADTTQLFKRATLNALSNKRETVKLSDFENALNSLTLPSFLKGHKGNPFSYSPKTFDKACSNL